MSNLTTANNKAANIDEFLTLEREYRKNKKWFMFWGVLKNDNGIDVLVKFKSFGFYNQIFELNDDGIDRSFGHQINKVGDLHSRIRNEINV